MWKFLLAFTGLALSGCTSTPSVPGDMAPMDRAVVMVDAVSPEDSSVGKDEAEAMIVLTLTQEAHESLTSGKRVAPEMTMGVNINTDATPVAYNRFLNELTNQYGLVRVADWPLESIGARCLVFTAVGSLPRDEIVASLSKDSRVKTAQALNIFSVLGDTDDGSYNDPYLDLQHGFRTMQVESSHQWSTGSDVSIAVVDTGVDITHPDLKDRISMARNFVDRNSSVFNADVHGTAVSGVIAATGNNAHGIVGVAPRAKLLALKGCWQQSAENTGAAVCSSFTLAKSIDFAILQHAEVINLSLTGPPDLLLESLVKNAIKKGISVVGALDVDQPDNFPAYIDGVLTVSNSNALRQSEYAKLKAPGKKIFSAKPGEVYDFFSGSSISAAQVSGLVALIKERRPHLDASEILNLLQLTSIATRSGKETSSVNACRAVAKLVGVGDSKECRN